MFNMHSSALPHCVLGTPIPFHSLSCPPPILIVCFRVKLGFCIINMLQQWFQGRRWQTSLRKSFPPSLWKMVRVAWQQIRLCQKYQQFKLIWKDALGKENQFQFSIKVLGKKRRPRFLGIYLCGQSNELGAAQPSFWTSELPVTYTKSPASRVISGWAQGVASRSLKKLKHTLVEKSFPHEGLQGFKQVFHFVLEKQKEFWSSNRKQANKQKNFRSKASQEWKILWANLLTDAKLSPSNT